MKRSLLVLIPAALYVVACCLPAIEWKNSAKPNDVSIGLRALALGWAGLFAGVLAWYANPLWLAGVVLTALRKPMWGIVPGLIAITIACTVFRDIGRELPADEGDVAKMTMIRLLPGCYVWLASLVSLPIVGLIQKLLKP